MGHTDTGYNYTGRSYIYTINTCGITIQAMTMIVFGADATSEQLEPKPQILESGDLRAVRQATLFAIVGMCCACPRHNYIGRTIGHITL